MTFCEPRPSGDVAHVVYDEGAPASPEGKWRVWQPRKRGPMSKEEWRKKHPHRKRKWVRSAPAHAA